MHLTFRILLILSIGTMPFADARGMCGETHSDEPLHRETRASDPETGSGANPGVWLASFFRDHISAVDGSRCPSLPTCSSFSIEAFKKHGFFIGWTMMANRLVHEIDEWTVSPIRMVNGEPKIIDPVENNDFWWFRPFF
jgi:hypothetical protein